MQNQSTKMHTVVSSSEDRALLLQTALYAGELLVRNGAEMYRVEETLLKICESRGAANVTPFVTPTLIFIADESEKHSVYTKNIKKRSNNISKIAMVNDFSRKFVEGKIELAKAMQLLKSIESNKGYPYWLVLLAAGVGCGIFAVLVGGKIGDFIASMFVGIISVASFQIKLVDNLDSIIVGAALSLVPGVAFTAGIRDFISGDLISGIARIGESILVAIAIAFGVGSILMLYSMLGGL